MTKNQIIKLIRNHLNSKYSGKEFYKIEFDTQKTFKILAVRTPQSEINL